MLEAIEALESKLDTYVESRSWFVVDESEDVPLEVRGPLKALDYLKQNGFSERLKRPTNQRWA